MLGMHMFKVVILMFINILKQVRLRTATFKNPPALNYLY